MITMTDSVEKDVVQEEMEMIKERLDAMNIKYHHNAKLETLKTLLNDSLNASQPKVAVPDSVKSNEIKLREEAFKLLKCAIHCNNPGKRQLKGEFTTVGNSVHGHHTFFVPYNCPEAEDFVLPKIVIDALRERRFLSKAEEMVHDIHDRSFYMAPEFTISILGDA